MPAPCAPRASGMWQPWQIARYSAAPSRCTKYPRAECAPVASEPGGENGGNSSAEPGSGGSASASSSARERIRARAAWWKQVYISGFPHGHRDGAPMQAADRVERGQHGAFLPRRQIRDVFAGEHDAAVELAEVVVMFLARRFGPLREAAV